MVGLVPSATMPLFMATMLLSITPPFTMLVVLLAPLATTPLSITPPFTMPLSTTPPPFTMLLFTMLLSTMPLSTMPLSTTPLSTLLSMLLYITMDQLPIIMHMVYKMIIQVSILATRRQEMVTMLKET